MAAFPSPKDRHPFHMHSMIRGQPGFIRETLDRVQESDVRRFRAPSRHLVMTGCGTSFHAALYGARVLQAAALSGEVVEAIPAYDLAYGRMPRKATVFGVSHSGSTPTTNRALARAARGGLRTLGMCGLPDSPMEELVDEMLVIGSTHDRSWANTMSYTTQLSAFAALASFRRHSEPTRREVETLPALVQKALRAEVAIRRLSSRVSHQDRVTFLGTGLDEVTSLEAALKIRETAGLVSSGYHAEQFLHGPFLSLDRKDAIVFLLAREDRARAAEIVRALARTGAAVTTVGEAAGASIHLPPAPAILRPIVSIVPMQFLAYYAALARHENPDIMRSDNPRFRAGIEALFH
jgi:glutamine---fructose-6-phosphate transaminase (isomerizing)